MGKKPARVCIKEGVRVAGTRHYPENCARFVQERRRSVLLIREPDNERDPNAIQVVGKASGDLLGHLPPGTAASIARAQIAGDLTAKLASTNVHDKVVICLDLFAAPTDAATYRRETTIPQAEALGNWPEFHGKRFGAVEPSIHQFSYAVALGIDPGGHDHDSIGGALGKARRQGQTRPGPMPRDCELEHIHRAMKNGWPKGTSPANRPAGCGTMLISAISLALVASYFILLCLRNW
jgi:hypothetical protein